MNRIRTKLERNQSQGLKWESFGVHFDLGTSSGRPCREERKRIRKTFLGEERSVLRESLTAPTLLEMSGYRRLPHFLPVFPQAAFGVVYPAQLPRATARKCSHSGIPSTVPYPDYPVPRASPDRAIQEVVLGSREIS
jgi:hypothetical protein